MINDNFLKNKVSNLTGFVTNTATEIKSVVKKNAGKFLNFDNVVKDKLKAGNLKNIHDGMPAFSKNKATNVNFLDSDGKVSPKDWRVSISIPPRILEYAGQDSLLTPLLGSGNRLIFPYTPTVLVSHSANYNPMQPLHTNYPYYAYENSRVDQITITADMFVQNEAEAQYWLAMTHFLKTVTKMSYGKNDPDRGLPPPVCRLNGYGQFTFNNVPVIITNFQFDLKKDVDYISTKLVGSASNVPDAISGTPAKNTGSAVGGLAWAPTESLITVGLIPQYSRTKQTQFNLKDFIKGNHAVNKDGFV